MENDTERMQENGKKAGTVQENRSDIVNIQRMPTNSSLINALLFAVVAVLNEHNNCVVFRR